MIKEQNKKRYVIILILCMIANIVSLFFIDPSKRYLPISMIVIILGLLTIQITRKDE